MTTIVSDRLPLPLLRSGKVSEVYEVESDRLLLVASDRVSAFDVVMKERVPYKGAVLTQMTAWWLRQFAQLVPHHMLASTADEHHRGGTPRCWQRTAQRLTRTCHAVPAHRSLPC